MKNIIFAVTASLFFMLTTSFDSFAQKEENKKTIETNVDVDGVSVLIEFAAGVEHNHPTMAIWVENMDGKLIQTLYVTESLATGTYQFGDAGDNRWKRGAGEARRPATLPYWLHKRGIEAADGTYLPTPENPLPDAITGATPKHDFTLKTTIDLGGLKKFRILLEINQTWDWNEFWHNSKFPEDEDYKTSSQPAVVYAVTIDLESEINTYYLNPVGHSHYSGKEEYLYTDLSTLTTALKIVKKIKVSVPKKE